MSSVHKLDTVSGKTALWCCWWRQVKWYRSIYHDVEKESFMHCAAGRFLSQFVMLMLQSKGWSITSLLCCFCHVHILCRRPWIVTEITSKETKPRIIFHVITRISTSVVLKMSIPPPIFVAEVHQDFTFFIVNLSSRIRFKFPFLANSGATTAVPPLSQWPLALE